MTFKTRTILWLITFAAIIALGLGIAFAAPQCNERDAVLSVLEEKYEEKILSGGVANNGGLVEVLTSEDGKTWSIIITSPKGISCLVAAGEWWQRKKEIVKGDGV